MPSPRTQRSFCFVSSWPYCDVRWHAPGSAGPTGRSSPPWPGSCRGALGGLPRLPRDDPALAPGARPPALDVPEPITRTSSPVGGDHPADRPSGTGESPLGLPAHRRRTEEAGCHRLEGQRRQRSATSSAPTSATKGRTHLDRVPARPGQEHRSHRLLHHRHRFPPSLLRALRHRGGTTRRPPPRRHGQSQRILGDPSRTQPLWRARRDWPEGAIPHPRPRHQVHRQLRQRLRLDRRRDHPHPGALPKGERVR